MSTYQWSSAVNDDVEVPSPGADEVWTACAVIVNREGRAFAQKRRWDHHLFPGAWDIVGGHVEEGKRFWRLSPVRSRRRPAGA
jgi:hypothetical protein